MELYHHISHNISRLFTRKYSTSFSLGIAAFAKKYRQPVYDIYGYVRVADEIVDSFTDYDRKPLLLEFREETFRAIERGVSTNPVIHAFQETVRRYNVDLNHIREFLDSMEMDLYNSYYEKDRYDDYIYGSAEVVGLMCLKVFVDGNQEMYDKLELPAKALGSALQKVNFLRDMKSDLAERGRIYLPGIGDVVGIDDESKRRLEDEIEKEFSHALQGIRQLPAGVRLGVYSAYLYYYQLFNIIKKSKVKTLLERRVRVSNTAKFFLLLKSFLEVKVLKVC